MLVTVFAVAAVTVTFARPLTPSREAMMVVEPAATPVATPEEFTEAIAELVTVQLAVVVTFAVELSSYVAVAVNCWVAPTTKLALVGETVMDVNVLAAIGTVTVACALTPLNVAVTVVEPAATPVNIPAEFTIASVAFAVLQVAVFVTFAVELSL